MHCDEMSKKSYEKKSVIVSVIRLCTSQVMLLYHFNISFMFAVETSDTHHRFIQPKSDLISHPNVEFP